jgi:peptide/nickel transport system permease protein
MSATTRARAQFWPVLRRDPLLVPALVVLALAIFVTLFCAWLAPQNPYDLAQLNITDGMLPPLSSGFDGRFYLLGTDDQGRDILSGILYGLRTSVVVGVSSGCIAAAIGTSIGLLAGYFGGIIDSLLMRIVDLQLSLPAILIALVLVATVGNGAGNIVLALVIVQWAYFARTARSAAVVERRKDYIQAARSLRIGSPTIIFREMLPNCLPPLIVIASAEIASAIRLEATLSFLGLGLPITQPSLGLMIANGYQYMLSGQYWISIYPGLVLLVVIASLNTLGDHVRDASNPRRQR